MATTTATPKIVGKALYLELVANPDNTEDENRKLIGWQAKGTKQLIIFPQYQDDTGKIHEPIMLERVVSEYRPRAQWDTTRIHARTKPVAVSEIESGGYSDYVRYPTYTSSEWDELTEREKHNSRQFDLQITLRRSLHDTMVVGEGDERVQVAKQAWAVRDSKPIVVEVTDQDLSDLYGGTTPQAVIRRINKVRDTLDKFPKKLV